MELVVWPRAMSRRISLSRTESENSAATSAQISSTSFFVGGRGGERHDAEFHAHKWYEHHGEQAHKGQAGLRGDFEGYLGHALVPERQRIAHGKSHTHESTGHGEGKRRRGIAFGGEDAEVHDKQYLEERLHADAHYKGEEKRRRSRYEQRESDHDGHEQCRINLENVESVAGQGVDTDNQEDEKRAAQNAARERPIVSGKHLPGNDAAEKVTGDAGEPRDSSYAEHALQPAFRGAAGQEHGESAAAVGARESQDDARGQGQKGGERRGEHRGQCGSDNNAYKQGESEDRADVADREICLNASVVLAPEYPQYGLGGGNDDSEAVIDSCGNKLEGEEPEGDSAHGGYHCRKRKRCSAIAEMVLAAEDGGDDEQEQGRGHEVHNPADSHAVVEEMHIEEKIGDEPEGVVPCKQQGESDVLHHGTVEKRSEGPRLDRSVRSISCMTRCIHAKALSVSYWARRHAIAVSA